MADSALQLGPVEVDLVRHEVVGPAGRHTLSVQEVALLRYLAERRGLAVPRDELLQAVWGYHPNTRTRAVDHTVNRLRKKVELEPGSPRFLKSVSGVGDRLDLAQHDPAPTAFERPHVSDRASAFVGRTKALAELDDLLATHRLVTLVGPGGAGKTRLALRLAARTARQGTATFVDLVRADSALTVLRAIAAASGVVGSPTPAGVLRTLAHALAERDTLLVLDNFEQVQPHAAVVGELLSATRHLRVVVTSRVALGLPEEWVYPVGGLAPADASALLVSLADGEHLTTADPVVASIVERLNHQPLAIELVAPRLRLFDPQTLLDRLEQPLAVLRSRGSGRHATLRAVLQWSWDLLDSDAQRAWVQLGLFERDFALSAAEAVLDVKGEPLDALQTLIDNHLVHRRGDRLELRLPALEFARERLNVAPERSRWIARRTSWAAALGRRCETQLSDHGWDAAVMAELRAEAWNLRLAFEEGVGDDPEGATQGLLGLYAETMAGWGIERTSALLDEAVRRLPPGRLLGRALLRRARNHRFAMRPAAAAADLERARELLSSDPAQLISVLAEIAANAGRDGRPDEAHLGFLEAWDLAEAAGQTHNFGWLGANLGTSALFKGDLAQAEIWLQRALDLQARSASPMNRGRTLTMLASLHVERGRADLAVPYHERARQEYQSVGDHMALAQNAVQQVQLRLSLGDLEGDEPAAEDAILRCRAIGLQSTEALAQLLRGQVLQELGRDAEADTCVRQSLAAYEAIGSRRWQANASLTLARLLLLRGETGLAAERVAAAEAWLDGTGLPLDQATVSVHAALVAIADGTSPTAWLEEARSRRHEQDVLGHAMLSLAEAAAQGQRAPATDLHSHPLRILGAWVDRRAQD